MLLNNEKYSLLYYIIFFFFYAQREELIAKLNCVSLSFKKKHSLKESNRLIMKDILTCAFIFKKPFLLLKQQIPAERS